MKKVKRTLYLPEEIHKALKRIYAETGETVTSLIERACVEFLIKEKDVKKSNN